MCCAVLLLLLLADLQFDFNAGLTRG